MLMQVLQLTPDQISALDAGQRDSIMLLVRDAQFNKRQIADCSQRRQFLGAAA
jgi:DNA polymerase III psi subunit